MKYLIGQQVRIKDSNNKFPSDQWFLIIGKNNSFYVLLVSYNNFVIAIDNFHIKHLGIDKKYLDKKCIYYVVYGTEIIAIKKEKCFKCNGKI